MNQKILIVEDDDDNRVLLAKLLESQGYEVFEASDGGEAIDLVKSALPDLVLMDMGLPFVSGYDATRTIKKNPELQKIPIIALTAFAMEHDKQKVIEAGCNGYITKPYDIFDLLERIKEYLQNNGNGGSNNP